EKLFTVQKNEPARRNENPGGHPRHRPEARTSPARDSTELEHSRPESGRVGEENQHTSGMIQPIVEVVASPPVPGADKDEGDEDGNRGAREWAAGQQRARLTEKRKINVLAHPGYQAHMPAL